MPANSVGRRWPPRGGPEAIARTQARLDPGVLTLGFARRFATYKRPNLLLHDPERLLRILKNPSARRSSSSRARRIRPTRPGRR
jgi:glucan phosphorylase